MTEYIVNADEEKSLMYGRKYEELIRCKNCVKSQYDFMTKGYWCDGKQVSENHYCGYAERRTDNG